MTAPKRPKRRNQAVFGWLRAAVFFIATVAALRTMPFYPGGVDWLIALVVAALALFSPGLGVLGFVLAAALPMAEADLVIGGLFLVVGFAAVQYLGQGDARTFVVIALAFILARAGLPWAVVALAGYILGAGEGAIAAAIACILIELLGVLTGSPSMGPLATGGSPGPDVLGFDGADAALSFRWIADAVRDVEPGRVFGTFTRVSDVALLVLQPIIWAGGAALAGNLRRPLEHPRRALVGLLAVAAGTAAIAAASTIAMVVLGGPVQFGVLALGAALSVPAAVAGAAIWEWVFPPVPAEPEDGRRHGSMEAEDADVDELLRLIASAEEELASKHTTQSVVMITDMKSFSKMTEEEGSFVSAKLIQRHRDLLLPIISEHGGRGKSTGGDGLVAAFQTPGQAVAAAVEMQRALAQYNASKTGERELSVRIGIASGEVVLDKGGRPFIGAALNSAARVMNLADGGQAMTVREIADAAGPGFRLHSHGRFELKNIAQPVEVIEILWSDTLEPKAPPLEPLP